MLSLSLSLSLSLCFSVCSSDGHIIYRSVPRWRSLSFAVFSSLQRNQRHYREEREREDRVGECASIRVHVPAELKREKEKESLNEWSTRINEHSNGGRLVLFCCPMVRMTMMMTRTTTTTTAVAIVPLPVSHPRALLSFSPSLCSQSKFNYAHSARACFYVFWAPEELQQLAAAILCVWYGVSSQFSFSFSALSHLPH